MQLLSPDISDQKAGAVLAPLIDKGFSFRTSLPRFPLRAVWDILVTGPLHSSDERLGSPILQKLPWDLPPWGTGLRASHTKSPLRWLCIGSADAFFFFSQVLDSRTSP